MPDLPALRQRAFDQVLLIFAVLQTVAAGLSLYRNLSIDWNSLVFVNLAVHPGVRRGPRPDGWARRRARRRLAAAAPPGTAGHHLTVADTGPGIAVAEQERLFAVVVPTAPDTAADAPTQRGLGLIISQGLARQMGGRIELVSAPGVGSRFTVILPAVALTPCEDAGTADAVDPSADPVTGAPVVDPAPLPPPPAALAQLRALAELGRTTCIEDWCRHWSAPERRPAFAARVLGLAHAFEHGAILDLVDAAAAPGGAPAAAASQGRRP